MSEYVFRRDPAASSPFVVLAGGAQTGGAAVFGEAVLPPGSPSPSLHVHTREDESMYVIEGVMTVQVGDQRCTAHPGDLVWLPRDVPHTFANLGTATARVVGMITPAGVEGMFAEQAAYFASLDGPPDPDAVPAIGARYGVTQLGPPLT